MYFKKNTFQTLFNCQNKVKIGSLRISLRAFTAFPLMWAKNTIVKNSLGIWILQNYWERRCDTSKTVFGLCNDWLVMDYQES